ncbi:hypothetical protein PSAB6_510022 [Paraburkholderia sabiae]|nr:hypothetical protein PSAB6_510022 [Paraburkholderia sabiae]
MAIPGGLSVRGCALIRPKGRYRPASDFGSHPEPAIPTSQDFKLSNVRRATPTGSVELLRPREVFAIQACALST